MALAFFPTIRIPPDLAIRCQIASCGLTPAITALPTVNRAAAPTITRFRQLRIGVIRTACSSGLLYTYSKAMDYANLPTYRSCREWSYGKADFDQTHVMVINYSYDLPRFSKLVANRVTRIALDNWQFSGITTFASGTPLNVNLTTTNGVDLTGGGDGQRVNINGDPRLAHGDRTVNHFLNTSVFSLPVKGDAGNAARDLFRGPGLINSDVTLFKNFPIRSERRSLQLRWEVYNIFNHTNFSSVDNTTRFDPNTGVQTNANFGRATAARNPRLMQVSARFSF